jgi:glycosyltransferase involved in cell wall biosynthesis
MNLEKIYCVIPAYNEEKTIKKVVSEIKPLVGRIVIVDDCSEDKTVACGQDDNKVIILEHIINRGQGAALRTGTEYALREGAEIIIHFDADGQFLAGDLEKFIKIIGEERADIVFGSRFLDEERGDKNMPFLKKFLIMPLAKIVNKFFLGINLTDPQSGFRAFGRLAAEKIKWRQDRMAHCTEIMIEAKKSGLKIKEVPIKVVYHDFGQKFSGGIKILKDLIVGTLIK